MDKVINHTINFALDDPDHKTQVLLTADHETGGLQILGTGSLTGPLPNEALSLAVNIQRRTDRANQVQVSWGSGHTNTKVILAGVGPYTSQIAHARFNIDTFSLMRMAIEGVSGPVEQEVNDDNTTVVLVYTAFGGMGATVMMLALVYVWNIKKRRTET
jgi:alkaline phosphatase